MAAEGRDLDGEARLVDAMASRNGRILEIVLDRPKANTLDAPLSREMGKVFADFRDDPSLRVVILTG
ncbi:MAG: enoyl-CoA hydratase-related protein, partial [Acidimicrobiales bacterium]